MASEKLTLIEFIKILLGTGSESIQMRDYFNDDPVAALEEHGLGHPNVDDVRDAIGIAQDNDPVSLDRHSATGVDWAGTGRGGWDGGGKEGGHAAAVHEKVHVKDNFYEYNIDDRDTIVDNSINQNVDTGGGNFRQDIETNSVTASGDGAVAAGRDIEDSVITTGNGNIVGDDNNVVQGDGNTTAFGTGNATSVGDIKADNGSAVSIGGSASGSNDTTGSFNETTTTNTTTTEFTDSFNVDASQDNDTTITDDSTTENHLLSHNDVSADINVG